MADHNITFSNGWIRFSDCLTEAAKPNSEQEAHTHHDEMEVYWFLEGDLFFAFEGERIPVAPGDVIIIGSGLLHRPVLRSNCRYYRKRILFRRETFSEYCPGGMALYYRLASRRILHLRASMVKEQGMEALLAQLLREGSDSSDYGQFRTVTALCYFLMTAEAVCPAAPEARSGIPVGKAEKLLQYIEDNLSSELSYQTLAVQANLSVKSLYQFFKQETGFTLGNYIQERRIIKAKSLLNAGTSAGAAAAEVGFKDYSVFYRCFLRQTGMTPREYGARKRMP